MHNGGQQMLSHSRYINIYIRQPKSISTFLFCLFLVYTPKVQSKKKKKKKTFFLKVWVKCFFLSVLSGTEQQSESLPCWHFFIFVNVTRRYNK